MENVPVGGGTVELEGVAVVTIPPNTFTKTTRVELSEEDVDAYRDVLDESIEIFSVGTLHETAVKVGIEDEQPAANITVRIELPQSFVDAIDAGQAVRVFAAAENESDLEEPYPYFELVVVDFDRTSRTVSFEVEPGFFSRYGGASDNYFGLFVVGTTPGTN